MDCGLRLVGDGDSRGSNACIRGAHHVILHPLGTLGLCMENEARVALIERKYTARQGHAYQRQAWLHIFTQPDEGGHLALSLIGLPVDPHPNYYRNGSQLLPRGAPVDCGIRLVWSRHTGEAARDQASGYLRSLPQRENPSVLPGILQPHFSTYQCSRRSDYDTRAPISVPQRIASRSFPPPSRPELGTSPDLLLLKRSTRLQKSQSLYS